MTSNFSTSLLSSLSITVRYAEENNINLWESDEKELILIEKGQRGILISATDSVYTGDIVRNFDGYYETVSPIVASLSICKAFSKIKDRLTLSKVIDYSKTASHPLLVDCLPIPLWTRFAFEPVEANQQYIELLKLRPGDKLYDVGAYNGFTALYIAMSLGDIAIKSFECDPLSLKVLKKNLVNYRDRLQGANSSIELIESAVVGTKSAPTIDFSSEGATGSSLSTILPLRGKKCVVSCITFQEALLGESAPRDKMKLKIDIEGGELELVQNSSSLIYQAFSSVVVEAHKIGTDLTLNPVLHALETVGYNVQIVEQRGFGTLPLIFAYDDDAAESDFKIR